MPVLDIEQMNSEHDKSVRHDGGHDYLYERIASRVRQQIVDGVPPPPRDRVCPRWMIWPTWLSGGHLRGHGDGRADASKIS